MLIRLSFVISIIFNNDYIFFFLLKNKLETKMQKRHMFSITILIDKMIGFQFNFESNHLWNDNDDYLINQISMKQK